MFKNVWVIGMGLMGGSFALEMQAQGLAEALYAVDVEGHEQTLQDAGFLLGDLTQLSQADLIILALPVRAIAPWIAAHASLIAPSTILMDLASSKAELIASIRPILGSHIARWIFAHPIAGKAQHGFAAAELGVFKAKPVILTPLPETDAAALAKMTLLWQHLGADISHMTPEAHDAFYGRFSHLPNLLAFLLHAQRQADPDGPAALLPPSWQEMTRLAASSPLMWRDICLTNTAAILEALKGFEQDLQALKTCLLAGDEAALLFFLENCAALQGKCKESGKNK